MNLLYFTVFPSCTIFEVFIVFTLFSVFTVFTVYTVYTVLTLLYFSLYCSYFINRMCLRVSVSAHVAQSALRAPSASCALSDSRKLRTFYYVCSSILGVFTISYGYIYIYKYGYMYGYMYGYKYVYMYGYMYAYKYGYM
jgi:hypothetical protein